MILNICPEGEPSTRRDGCRQVSRGEPSIRVDGARLVSRRWALDWKGQLRICIWEVNLLETYRPDAPRACIRLFMRHKLGAYERNNPIAWKESKLCFFEMYEPWLPDARMNQAHPIDVKPPSIRLKTQGILHDAAETYTCRAWHTYKPGALEVFTPCVYRVS